MIKLYSLVFAAIFTFAPTLAISGSLIDSKNNLFVFVGEKILVEEFELEYDDNVIVMDSAFKVKFRVIEPVYGSYDGSIIEFEAYDHYGKPAFSKHQYSLMFVSEHEGKLYHEKYQYFAVDNTVDNKWAFCGDPNDYDRKDVAPASLVDIEFNPPVTLKDSEIAGLSDVEIDEYFPPNIWERADDSIYCFEGVYVEELFRIKKEGVLRARELFD